MSLGRHGRPSVLVPLLAVVLGLIALGAALLVHARSSGAGGAAATGQQSVALVDRGTVPMTSGSSSQKSPRSIRHHRVLAGSRLRYGRLHVDAPIVTTAVHDGVMVVPRDPHTLGWWSGSAGAGDATGSVVVVGHVNYAGATGALGVLPRSRPGDVVSVVGPSSHTVRYRVAALRRYPKTSGIPASAFARTGPPQLVLITCGGPFDPSTGNYLDNVVVYAIPM